MFHCCLTRFAPSPKCVRVLFAALAFFICMNAARAQTFDALPTLRGDEAIEKLKQSGQYDSLMEAVEAARKEQPDDALNENAVGQTAKIVIRDGTVGDSFGISVAISGNTAIVGALTDGGGTNVNQGSAYIFVRSGVTWSLQQQLTASDGAAFDLFGASVAISGETAIVGANADDFGPDPTSRNQGSAYIFVRSGTMWSEQQKLTASDSAADDRFGASVAISGETAIVGAYGVDVVATDQGAAYIFVRSGTVWSEQQQLTASDRMGFDNFGSSVAISGNTAIVGAFQDRKRKEDRGSAYIFVRSGVTWSLQQKLTASDGAAVDQFGTSVGISDETAIVGAILDDVGANPNQGSAYIFVRSGTVWSEQQKLTASDGAAGDNFGRSVAISGNTAIIGAVFDNVGVNTDQGAAYIFVRSGTVWSEQQKLTAFDGAAEDNFGRSVAISGSNMIVGSIFDDIRENNNQGSAYIFEPLQPTAATVSISGRVVTPQDLGLTNARVTLTDARGDSRTILTGRGGIFRFTDVAAGETYIIGVSARRYTFAPQVFTVNEDLTDIIFTPLQ